MSFYLCRHTKVEAEPVLLAGEQYYAVAVHGKGHLVHGPAFELMFQRVAVEAAAPVAVEELPVVEPTKTYTDVQHTRSMKLPAKKGGRKSASPKAAPAPAPAPTTAKASPLQQKVLDALAGGPLTTVELATTVYADLDRKTACMNIYPLTAGMKDKGLIERREDKDAGGLVKWFKV